MKYLFDSSAIFKSIKENKIELLAGNATLELARYELGNIIWKNCFLQAKITKEEMQMLVKALKQTLGLMEVITIACSEEGILGIATQLKVTFYDASYAYHAKSKELTLVTEDLRLIKKITPIIRTLRLNEVEQDSDKRSVL
jgi:predicted nucleic acid-binding protein